MNVRTSPEHVLMIGQDFMSGEWTVNCVCGWEGHVVTVQDDAIDEWEGHRDSAYLGKSLADHLMSDHNVKPWSLAGSVLAQVEAHNRMHLRLAEPVNHDHAQRSA